MSLYKTAWDKKKLKNVTLEEYVRRVVEGTYQDQVIEARRLRSVDKDKYLELTKRKRSRLFQPQQLTKTEPKTEKKQAYKT